MAGRRLSVATLLREQKLGLRVVVEGDLMAEVCGAHAIEIADAAHWLEPGWLMLTTGLRFVGSDSAAEQEELVGTLVERGVAALLFGIGLSFPAVPQGLVRAAEGAGLTLLTVAADVPFLQIEQFVSRSLTTAAASSAQQQLALQNDLLDSLAGDQPIVDLVRRLSGLIKGTAVLYEDSGRVVASTGEGPMSLIWTELQSAPSGDIEFTVGRWSVLARPVFIGGVGYWVALASRRATVLEELGVPVLDATTRMLGAIRGVRALSAAHTQAEAAQLMQQLEAGLTPEMVSRSWERLRTLRFERGLPLRAFVTSQAGSAPRRAPLRMGAADPIDEAILIARDFALPVLVTLDPETGQMSGVVSERAILTDWTEHLSVAGFNVGLSEPFSDLNQVRAALRDAGRALRVAERRASYPSRRGARSVGSVLRFEDSDMVTWLVSSRGAEAFAAKAQQQFGTLLERPDLVETLSAYLAVGMDVKATAERLFLHPNSVRYRLRRVEELIGAPLTSAAVIANLYLALHEVVPEAARPVKKLQ